MRWTVAVAAAWLACGGVAHADNGDDVWQRCPSVTVDAVIKAVGGNVHDLDRPEPIHGICITYGFLPNGKAIEIRIHWQGKQMTATVYEPWNNATPDTADKVEPVSPQPSQSTSVQQQQPKAYEVGLVDSDLPAIVAASQKNEMRFERDYKNHPFDATMQFKSASEHAFGFGGFAVLLQSSAGQVHCDFDDAAMKAKVADWSPRQSVRVHGIINDTTLGSVDLHDCTMH